MGYENASFFYGVRSINPVFFLSEFYETWVTLYSTIMSHDGQYHTMPSRVIALCSSKKSFFGFFWERSDSVVECLTRDRRAAGSSLTGITALWSLSKTHLS